MYDLPLYRPPAEGDNIIIQATLGCSFNKCSFCSMYRSKQYVERPLTDVFDNIHQTAANWPDAHRVFLADGDALALPTGHLLEILYKLHSAFPNLTRVSCYATPSNLHKKSLQELILLRQNGLKLLYIGVESGSNIILKKITKGATQKLLKNVLGKVYDSGIKVSATVILGLGGSSHSLEHINGTIELFNEAPVTYLSTLQLNLEKNITSEFFNKFSEPFIALDDIAILKEQEQLVSGLHPPHSIIFRSNHISNALALAGNLSRDREKLLLQISEALKGERALRPYSMRRM